MIWLGAVIVIVHKQTNQQMSTFYDMKQSKIKATQQYIGQSYERNFPHKKYQFLHEAIEN